MPAKVIFPSNRGITETIIEAICEKRVVDLTCKSQRQFKRVKFQMKKEREKTVMRMLLK